MGRTVGTGTITAYIVVGNAEPYSLYSSVDDGRGKGKSKQFITMGRISGRSTVRLWMQGTRQYAMTPGQHARP